jgi:hypothetical protein
VRLLRPNHGRAPLQAVVSSVNSRPTHRSRRALTSAESWPCPASSGSLFGQLETDASLQACAYFGRIMALPRFERFSLRSTRDRRIAPGVRLPRPNHGPAPLQAVLSSITTISDRLGVRALKRSAPRLLLTAPKATSETRPPRRRWPSFDRVARAFFLERKVNCTRRDGG